MAQIKPKPLSRGKKILLYILGFFLIIGMIGNCNDYVREQNAKAHAKDQAILQKERTRKDSIKAVTDSVAAILALEIPIQQNLSATNRFAWKYDSIEDRMTSEYTYIAENESDEQISTGGHWEDYTTTTTTSTNNSKTKTELKEKRPWWKSSQSTTSEKKSWLNNNAKKYTATSNTTNTNTTTTTNSTQPRWISTEGYMKIALRSSPTKKISITFYSTTGSLPIDFATVRVRFDNNAPKRFTISRYSRSGSAIDGFSINSPKEFLPLLKKSKTILVEFGSEVAEYKSIFTFPVDGLVWNH